MNKKFLNYTDWQGTADTLHMYLQMLGKVKLSVVINVPSGHTCVFT